MKTNKNEQSFEKAYNERVSNYINSLKENLGEKIHIEALSTVINETHMQLDLSRETIQILINLNTLLQSDPISVMNSISRIDGRADEIRLLQESAKNSIKEIIDKKTENNELLQSDTTHASRIERERIIAINGRADIKH